MSETTANTTTAYGDESVRVAGNPPFYMLGASLLTADSVPELESIHRSLSGGPRKLHWREMGRKKQRDSLGVLAEIDSTDIVAFASPLAGKKQERARRKCLQAMIPHLEGRGIERLVLESRRPGSDKQDLDFVSYVRGSKLINSIRIEHEYGTKEPRPWVADLLLGAMGDYLTQTGEWKYWESEWKAIGGNAERIDVGL